MSEAANWKETQLGPVIGSEVTGIDLNNLDNGLIATLRERLAERQVLVVRNQNLNRDAHKAVARIFGTGKLHCHALGKARGTDDPEVLPVQTNANSKFTAGEGWHTDVSCDPDPIAASLLYMHQAPAGGGGDTIYSSMYECYDRLSDPIKQLAEQLEATHDGAFPYRQIYGIEPDGGQYNRTVHPVVIKHPVTGRKLLWINRGFVTGIKGLSHVEARHIMELFFQHVESTLTAQCRVRWEDRTVVIWDNVATQHHAVWDYFPNSRYAERISVVGPVLSG